MASSPEKCNMLWAVLEQPVLVLACAYASCELNSVQEVTGHHSGLQGTENVCTLPICKLMHAYMYYPSVFIFLFWGHQSHSALAIIIRVAIGSALIGGCPIGWVLRNLADASIGCAVSRLATFLQHLCSFSRKTCFYMLGMAGLVLFLYTVRVAQGNEWTLI